MIISRRALRQVGNLAVDTAAEFPPEQLLHCIYCTLKGSDSETFLYVWDFGKSLSRGIAADRSIRSFTVAGAERFAPMQISSAES